MDEGCNRAVTEVFVRLYNKGLIYRGDRIINWCTDCKTALSDAEVEHEEEQGNLWYIRYPIKDTDEAIMVATTRPETMLGILQLRCIRMMRDSAALLVKLSFYPSWTGRYLSFRMNMWSVNLEQELLRLLLLMTPMISRWPSGMICHGSALLTRRVS